LKQKYLILGVVLMVIGIVLYMIAAIQLSDYEGVIGMLGRALSPEMQQQYETLKTCQTIGLISGAGGLLLSVVGFISSKKE
jgi:uncharacterized membrane protein